MNTIKTIKNVKNYIEELDFPSSDPKFEKQKKPETSKIFRDEDPQQSNSEVCAES